MDKTELDYSGVMNSYAEKAEEQAILTEDPNEAWIYVDNAVWWPNPLYCGDVEMPHPEQN